MAAPLRVEYRPVDALIPYARNSRTHSEAQVAQIAASIREFGWTNPVLLDGANGIIAGHGRVLAARMLGEVEVPTIELAHLTEAQKRAYVIADNKLALNAGWDDDLLRIELAGLEELGIDLGLVGFSAQEVAELFADGALDPGADPDECPGLAVDAVSKPGDVWILGPHRVACGSALEIDAWDRLMGGEKADVCWTDPPYNVDIGAKNLALDRADKGNRGKTGALMNDKQGDAAFFQFLLDAYVAMYAQLKPGAPIYVSHADIEGVNFRRAFVEAGFKLGSCIIWNKNIHVLGRWDWQPKHEPILYGWRPGSAHRWYGGRKKTSVIDLGEGGPFTKMDDGRWQIKIGDSVLVVSGDAEVEEHFSSVLYEPKPARSGLHPTMKPTALVERMLRASARAGDLVIDAFGGSGTTLIAADRLGMSARLMELDPLYVDVIVRRWQEFTGRSATLQGDGRTFESVAAAVPAALVAA